MHDIIAAAAPGAALVAFACSPEWIEAQAPTEGRVALPRFAMVAYTGGPMRLQGWRHPVIVDLAGLGLPTQHRPIRLGHDASQGVGHTDRLAVEGGQLVATGVVSRDTQAAREVVASSRNGFPWQASIGAAVEEHEFVREGATVLVNGRSFQGPVNVVRRSTLGEISFVDLGADGNTSAMVAATHPILDPQGDPPVLTPAPSSDTPSTTVPEATAPVVVQASAPEPVTPSGPTVADIRAQAVAETERIGAIRRLCGTGHAEIEARAIREAWDPTRTELEVIRADRPTAPAAHVRDNTLTPAILEAACLIAGQHGDLDEVCDDAALEAAQKRFRGGISIQELFLEAAWANGAHVRTFKSDPRAVLRAAFAVQAGLSSIDLGGILSNVANKFLLDGFNAVERTWRNISAVGPVSDFKAITRYRLIGKDQYEQVAPGGELKHGTLGEMSYSNKADTYGLMYAIDRRDLINDDLGAITSVPRKLGRGAGLKINDVFWSVFLNHAAFFTAAQKNLLVGADTALSIDGLTKAETAFLEQVDPDGKPLGVMPAIVLVPPSLSAYASQLFKSVELRETTANAKYPVANPHQGKFRVEVSRYISNPAFPGASQKAWYVLADPNDLPVIETVFLNGQESPVIETADADFSVLGVQMRGYHDFGCSLQEPRAAVKARGEA
ncbi:MAG: Mu-like prophage major head subunit gpT family protein [Planctomycetes bacterium]|nr:Mu-like prophage major head subunit gpT family protein [Planctomycetota bacterium]